MILHLRKLRIVVSVLFLLLTSLLFVDFKSWLPVWLNKYVLFFQFVPSVFKFIGLLALGSAGFIFIIALTALFGRVYCSSICPFGTMMDVISWVSKKFKKKKRFHEFKPYSLLRYSILGLTAASALGGTMMLVDLFDPYSNFGRIISNFVRPALIWVNNSTVYTLEKFKIYSLYPAEFRGIHLALLLFPAAVFITVAYLSYTRGRLYCNSICPVGSLLGLISKYSWWKLSIDKNSCNSCGRCERVCKAGCIDRKGQTIDYSRCVACFNCIEVCPDHGIDFERIFNEKTAAPEKKKEHHAAREIKTDVSKRNFLFNTAVFLIGSSAVSYAQYTQKKIKTYKKTTFVVFKKNPVTPPGSLGVHHFTGKCTACHLCVSACPTQVLQPAYLEYGLLGMMQPKMDYSKSYCNFECRVCGEVCPAGAILPVTAEAKKTLQMGKVKFYKQNCIVNTENTDCGACSEHCPTKAVNMVPFKGNLTIPEVKEDICVGCGACEYACPANPYKAIMVEGNPVHLVAKKPEVKKIQMQETKEDFPF